jgi:hypothetical protein
MLLPSSTGFFRSGDVPFFYCTSCRGLSLGLELGQGVLHCSRRDVCPKALSDIPEHNNLWQQEKFLEG